MKFNRKKIIFISTIGLVILLLIGGGVYYFVSRKNLSSNLNNKEQAEQPTQSQSKSADNQNDQSLAQNQQVIDGL